ncbi:MAG: DUF1552 domain-containing protein [Acidobacteria bacterium]|nr:DUF1552 domain-containing protein [Acidobacteriota bacterium]
MIITKRSLSRRKLLKGAGATLALPLLDAMAPALTALHQTPAKPAVRFGAVYVPNGVIPGKWFPTGAGTEFEFTPTLKPLEPYRDHLLVFSGLDSLPPPFPGERQINNHADASTRFLTDTTPARVLRAGISIDQVAAKVLGQETSLPSLEIALESVDSGTTCDGGRSCIYTGTISWTGPHSPLPMEHDPSAAFERLFGDSSNTDLAARRARMRKKNSILDAMMAEVARLQKRIGPEDRTKVSGYLESVRDLERRIQRAMEHNAAMPVVDRPAGIPEAFAEHARLMFDIQLLAYQADVTRVVTFMLGREFSGRTYPEIGVPDAHHPISHHQRNPVRMDKCAAINHYHVSLFSYFVEKMKNTPDGDGSLLDHSAIIYGAGMSEGNGHVPTNLPILVLGSAGGQLKGGRHIKAAPSTPLANLHVSLLNKLGVPVESHGNSTEPLEI